ncbi:MAG: hypothetical protein AB1638_11230 [Nitrospirota bacterium]
MLLSARKLKSTILKDRFNSLVLERGRGRELYLVGGYIRDALRGVISKDRDYIVSNDLENFVNEVKKITGGTMVELKKGQLLRLGLKERITLDFSRPLGMLKEDLSKRDFTINAMAWSREKGIIDPYKGLEDLRKKRIRIIRKENLISDPLRILRAYRFAAELDGSIERKTRDSIKILNNRIKRSAPERITSELFNLLNSEHPAKYLKMALSDGVLENILSFPIKALGENIKEICEVEKAISSKFPGKFKALLDKIFSQNLTYRGLLFLEILMKNGIERPNGARRIRMSNAIRKRLELAHRGIRKFETKGDLFNVFLLSREASVDVLIIKKRLEFLRDYERFKKIWKKGLLSAEEIIDITKIRKGPDIGKALIALRRAEFEGQIRNKKEAEKFIINLT